MTAGRLSMSPFQTRRAWSCSPQPLDEHTAGQAPGERVYHTWIERDVLSDNMRANVTGGSPCGDRTRAGVTLVSAELTIFSAVVHRRFPSESIRAGGDEWRTQPPRCGSTSPFSRARATCTATVWVLMNSASAMSLLALPLASNAGPRTHAWSDRRDCAPAAVDNVRETQKYACEAGRDRAPWLSARLHRAAPPPSPVVPGATVQERGGIIVTGPGELGRPLARQNANACSK